MMNDFDDLNFMRTNTNHSLMRLLIHSLFRTMLSSVSFFPFIYLSTDFDENGIYFSLCLGSSSTMKSALGNEFSP